MAVELGTPEPAKGSHQVDVLCEGYIKQHCPQKITAWVWTCPSIGLVFQNFGIIAQQSRRLVLPQSLRWARPLSGRHSRADHRADQATDTLAYFFYFWAQCSKYFQHGEDAFPFVLGLFLRLVWPRLAASKIVKRRETALWHVTETHSKHSFCTRSDERPVLDSACSSHVLSVLTEGPQRRKTCPIDSSREQRPAMPAKIISGLPSNTRLYGLALRPRAKQTTILGPAAFHKTCLDTVRHCHLWLPKDQPESRFRLCSSEEP